MTESGEQVPVPETKPHRWLGPAETLIGPIVAVAIAGVVIALGILGWWSVRAERTATVASNTARAISVGQLLADSVHAMLSDGDVAAVRRLIAQTGSQIQLQSCRVELPQGEVLADMDPSKNTIDSLPETWPGGIGSDEVIQQVDDGLLSLTFPIQLPGRGMVLLKMASLTDAASYDAGATTLVVAVVVGATLILIVLLYRPAKSRVEPFALIREALLAVEQGEADPQALKVSDALGPEAQAWNRLVEQRVREDKDSLLHRALDAAASGQGGAGAFATICDSLWHGVVLVGEDGKIKYANGAAAVLLKTKREELLNADAADRFTRDDIVAAIRHALDNHDRRRRTIDVDSDNQGRIEALRYNIRCTGDEQNPTALVVIEDITQQRVAEQSRRDFVAQVAHELRTPLTNISLNVETAVDDGEEDPEIRGRCLNVITQETQRLAQLVNDMLSVSEVEAGSMTLRHDDIRLDALFQDLLTDFEQQALEKQIKLNFDLPPKLPVIHGDRDKLAISLHNLMGNAIKYTPPGGEVVVSVAVEGDRISIVFKDKGIGIDKDELDKVFERFYRAKDSRVSQITGTGLGLPIAREIVRRHGGDIEVSSELNQGSTFTIHLPYTPEAA
ncbi:MAG: ATP-binding protein [Phycisphaeraceae bacterium]